MDGQVTELSAEALMRIAEALERISPPPPPPPTFAEADAYVFGAAPAPQKPKPKGFVIPDQPPTPAATGPAQPSAPVQIEMPVAPVPTPAPAPALATGLTPAKEAILAAKVIEELRPVFRRDGGDVELVDMEGSLVLVNLTGACSGCQLASATLGGIQKKITEALGRQVRVMPVAKT